MLFRRVCLEAIAYRLPDEVVTSSEIEARLEPLYRRLRLPEGRLELMTGIRERRFFPPGTRPGSISVQTAAELLEKSGVDRHDIGAIVHGSVSRDFLEPATAAGVHHGLGLSAECLVYDVSNACLGLLNGVVQVASLIELGQIRAGIVVGTECGRALVEHTIRTLNHDTSLTREQMKLAVASLTIGSASAAILLVNHELSRTGNRLLATTARAHTAGHELCQGDWDAQNGGDSHGQLMQTDSEQLLQQGVAAAATTFESFLNETGWTRDTIHKTIGHQVGSAHRKLLLETLKLDPRADFTTYETLGNTGSAALPVTLARAIAAGHLHPGDHLALLGIGSGINVLFAGLEWNQPLACPVLLSLSCRNEVRPL